MCVAFFELVEMWQLGIIRWSLKTAGGVNEADVLPAGHLGVYNKRTDFLICCGFFFSPLLRHRAKQNAQK